MPNIKNVIEKAESMPDKINPYYAMNFGNLMEIKEKSKGPFDMICYSFNFGYLQGMKAAKAEMRKGGVK